MRKESGIIEHCETCTDEMKRILVGHSVVARLFISKKQTKRNTNDIIDQYWNAFWTYFKMTTVVFLSKLLASLMRNYFPICTSVAPLHTLSKLYDVPVGFVSPSPSFEAEYCYICGRRRVAVDLSCSFYASSDADEVYIPKCSTNYQHDMHYCIIHYD